MKDGKPEEFTPGGLDYDSEESHEDFAALLEAADGYREGPRAEEHTVEGTVVSIGKEWVFVDIGAKSEAAIPREELIDSAGELTVGIGDSLTAYVVNRRGEDLILSVKMTSAASEDAIRGAAESGVPVEGLVTGQRKGGYSVRVFGRDAFCPFSQMDVRPGGDPESYVDQRFTFRILEYAERGKNIVLSRRRILEEELAERRAHLQETLHVGDVVEGEVIKLADFGAFVDIGGVEGLIPLSEMAWNRIENVAEVLSPGDRLTVKVIDVDWSRNRFALSRKQTLDDPWSHAEKNYFEGKTQKGLITRLANFGAFVELEPGVEGLVHISNLGMGRRINHPREVVSEGEEVEVTVLSVDQEARRIGLELNIVTMGEGEIPELRKGDLVTGTVDSVVDYGVFVSLPGGKTGLLHVSEIDGAGRGDLRKKFVPGTSVQVEILDVDPAANKTSLSTKTVAQRAEESQFKEYASSREGRSFGTLGDLLKDKLKA
jgi:small subunit ribosomal protein S1